MFHVVIRGCIHANWISYSGYRCKHLPGLTHVNTLYWVTDQPTKHWGWVIAFIAVECVIEDEITVDINSVVGASEVTYIDIHCLLGVLQVSIFNLIEESIVQQT